MLNFYDEAQAKAAYELTIGREPKQIFACTKAQLSWWLKFGNHKKPISLSSFPFDSENETMNQSVSINWTDENRTAAQLIYSWRNEDAHGELTEAATLDSILFDEIEDGATVETEAVFDALVVENKRLERTAQLLGNAFNRASGSLKVVENGIQISQPMKKNGTTNIAVMFEMTDGQTVSVLFHNPDTTPAKITPDDMLVSWKWLLNRKDITIVVAKEDGKDLPLPTVARRVMALVEKNTARFAKANANKAAETELLAQLEAEKAAKLARLAELNALAEQREDKQHLQETINKAQSLLKQYPTKSAVVFEYQDGAQGSYGFNFYNINEVPTIGEEITLIDGKTKAIVKSVLTNPENGQANVLGSESNTGLEQDNSGSLNDENPTIEVTGKEFGDFDASTEDGLKALRAAAKKFMMSLRGKWVHNTYLKRDIEIRKRGIRETFNYSANPIKLKLLAQIEQILATAKPVDGVQVEQPNYKKDVKPNAIRYFHLGNQAVVDGVPVKFDVIIEEDMQGVLHYDLVLEGSRKKAVMDSTDPSSITNTGTSLYPQQPETHSTELNDEMQDDNFIEQDGLFDDAVFDDIHSSGGMVLNLFVFDESGNPLPDEDEQTGNTPDNLDNIQYNKDLFYLRFSDVGSKRWFFGAYHFENAYAIIWEDKDDQRGYVFEINGMSGDFQAETLQAAVSFAESKIIDAFAAKAPVKTETNLTPKMPSLATLGIGKKLNKRLYTMPENQGWSNGDILDLSGINADIQGALQQHESAVQKLRPEQIERIVGAPISQLKIGQTFAYPIQSKHQFVELIDQEKQEVIYVAKQYFDYFVSKDKGATFFKAENSIGQTVVTVMNHSGTDKKGLIMPMKADVFQGIFAMKQAQTTSDSDNLNNHDPAKQQAIEYLNDIINGKIDGMADGILDRLFELVEPFEDDDEINELAEKASAIIENAMPKNIE